MLILARRINEQIYIGDDITLTIVDIDGRMCKVGIDAPPSVKILRREVAERDLKPEGT